MIYYYNNIENDIILMCPGENVGWIPSYDKVILNINQVLLYSDDYDGIKYMINDIVNNNHPYNKTIKKAIDRFFSYINEYRVCDKKLIEEYMNMNEILV